MSAADDQDERALVEAAQGDPARFLDLYDRHFHRVYAYALRRARSRAEAEDVTSEVFHRALANLRSFEWRGVPFVAWLFRIAANELADRRHQAGRQVSAPAGAIPATDAEFEQRVLVFQLLEHLEADQRRVVELRYGDGWSIRETADAIGKSEGAVKQLQRRALEKLRTVMETQHG